MGKHLEFGEVHDLPDKEAQALIDCNRAVKFIAVETVEEISTREPVIEVREPKRKKSNQA